MLEQNKPFKVYASCMLVKGHVRSIVYDLNRYKYYFIPNGLMMILKKYQNRSVREIKQSFDDTEHNIIEEYFVFLMQKEIIFFVEKKLFNQFPKIKTDWYNPSLFQNAIIEDDGNHNWYLIFNQLEEVLCKHLQIRFTNFIHFLQFLDFLKRNVDNSLISIEVIIPFDISLLGRKLNKFFKKFPLIVKYIIYSSSNNKIFYSGFSTGIGYYVTNNLHEVVDKQVVSKFSFMPEVGQFLEAKNHNIYYNKKVCIDKHGNIKIRINANEIFGNLYENSSLIKVYTESNSFKKYWNITKDKMLKCKDCEFRYMCLYDDEPSITADNKFYRYLHDCGYNPYKAQFDIDIL